MKWAMCAAAMVQTMLPAMCAAAVPTTLQAMCAKHAARMMHPAISAKPVAQTTLPATFANLVVPTMLCAPKSLGGEPLRAALRAVASPPASAARHARRWRGLIGSGGTGFDDATPLPATLALVRSVSKCYENNSELNNKYAG
jgi:hypothetical protein